MTASRRALALLAALVLSMTGLVAAGASANGGHDHPAPPCPHGYYHEGGVGTWTPCIPHETPPPPPPPVVKKTAVKFASRDWCNCFHDFAKVTDYNSNRLTVKKKHPSNTKWVYDLLPKANVKLTKIRHDGHATFKVARHDDGSARVVVKTTNEKCHGHPNGPTAPPHACKGDC